MAPPQLSLEQVKQRIVQVVTAGTSDERGGCDMAKLAPSYTSAYGESLVSSEHNYAKLSLLVGDMSEVVVDYCGPGTRSVIRLKGEAFTPKPGKIKAPKKKKQQQQQQQQQQPRAPKPPMPAKPAAWNNKQAAPGAGGGELVGLDEVKRRIVELTKAGNEAREGDSYGGVDMAHVGPLYLAQYGSKLEPSLYDYTKLGPMIADMNDVVCVDYVHRTKVVRLAGAPGVSALVPSDARGKAQPHQPKAKGKQQQRKQRKQQPPKAGGHKHKRGAAPERP